MLNAESIRAMKTPMIHSFTSTATLIEEMVQGGVKASGLDLLILVNTVIEDVARVADDGSSDGPQGDYTEDIKSMVVAYHAFSEAVQSSDKDGVVIWGRLMLEVQESLSIEVKSVDHIYDMIRRTCGVDPDVVL